ncbi:30S ribosomal protein S19e [Candidatus Woesearchaeota archaeon]|nr:30S ribosomal protein S19e [Candidatus Woesearchaeota archaeon]
MYDVDATELIEELAKEMQNVEQIEPPGWAFFVKTGVHKERQPAREDWWYVRAASVLRKVRLKGPIGVSKLRIFYGGKKNMGYAPERFKKGSGNIIRKILQQLEKAELIKKGEKGAHKGRVITPKGIKFIDNISNKISGHKPSAKPPEKKQAAKKEEGNPDVKKKEDASGKGKDVVKSKPSPESNADKEKKKGLKEEEKKPDEVQPPKADPKSQAPKEAEPAKKESAEKQNG